MGSSDVSLSSVCFQWVDWEDHTFSGKLEKQPLTAPRLVAKLFRDHKRKELLSPRIGFFPRSRGLCYQPNLVCVPVLLARGVESLTREGTSPRYGRQRIVGRQSGSQCDRCRFEELGGHDTWCGIYSLVSISDISNEINFIYFCESQCWVGLSRRYNDHI